MAEYSLQPWIFWLRISQIVSSIIIIALGAFAASQTWVYLIERVEDVLLINVSDRLWCFFQHLGSELHLFRVVK